MPQPSSLVREEFPPSEAFPTLPHTIQSAKITLLPVEPSSHLKVILAKGKGNADALREHPYEGGEKK